MRKALAARGQRTVFNILGPLINPGRPAHVLLGAFSAAWVPKLAGALEVLGTQAGLATHGVIDATRGIDELTTATTNRVRGFGRRREIDGDWRADDFGLRQSPFADLAGGDLTANLAILDRVLHSAHKYKNPCNNPPSVTMARNVRSRWAKYARSSCPGLTDIAPL